MFTQAELQEAVNAVAQAYLDAVSEVVEDKVLREKINITAASNMLKAVVAKLS